MKYRVQMNAVFNNSDSNDLLNHMESIKANVYIPDFYTPVYINKDTKKIENVEDNPIEYVSVDFEGTQESHLGTHPGDEFKMNIDVSFENESDLFSLLNYIETIKDKALVGDNERNCRYFECKHEELATPLPKDGSYSYIDFDSAPVTHS